MNNIQLSDYLQTLGYHFNLSEISIDSLAIDSRNVKKGSLYFALPGVSHAARAFIDAAIHNGAAAIFLDDDHDGIDQTKNVPIISIKDLKLHAGRFISLFLALLHDLPLDYLNEVTLIGITGTNGKSSCANLLAQAFNRLGKKAAMIGTIGHGFPPQLTNQELTTPDLLTLHILIVDYIKQGAKVITMEASSHALEQGRLSGVPFTIAIFTNLSRDHLDYHKTVEAYAKAKHKLFEWPTLQLAIFNTDDLFGREWYDEFKDKIDCISYGDVDADVIAKEIIYCDHSVVIDLVSPWGEMKMTAQLLGKFNVENLLAVIATLGGLNYSMSDIVAAIASLKPVVGRMQQLGGGAQPVVIIDFAHTPDALEKALKTARAHCEGELIVLFGCGGDRDRGKRPLMGEIAERLADKVILTNDNVRFEDEQQIVNDILKGCQNPDQIQVVFDRKKAIESAINGAFSQDVILLAGKGHETYQVIEDKKVPFSEFNIVIQALSRRK